MVVDRNPRTSTSFTWQPTLYKEQEIAILKNQKTSKKSPAKSIKDLKNSKKKGQDKMRVAVSATGANPDAAIDPRFGRCPYFIIVDTETLEFEAVPNTSQYAPSGAGIQSAQMIASKGAKVVLTGSVGPNAYQALSATGIQIINGVFGTVKEAVEKFKSGQLRQATTPTTQMGFGMGGFGMGAGRRSGRGMGRGQGMRTEAFASSTPIAPAMPTTLMPREQEIQMLENQMKILQQHLEQIKKRMKELEEK